MTQPSCTTIAAILAAACCLLPAATALLITDKTTDLPGGATCYKDVFVTTTCAEGLVCERSEITKEGFDLHYRGRCRAHPTPPPTCSVARCSQYGADAVCTLDSAVVTCAAWAGSPDFPECLRCPDASNWNCASPSLAVSTGASFCTECAVQTISCRNNFAIYGPIAPGGCYPYTPQNRNTCCRAKGAGCLKALDACKTSLSGNAAAVSSYTPCGAGLTCAAGSVPTGTDIVDGVCVPNASAHRWCNLWTCSTEGASSACSMSAAPGSARRIPGTCGAWAERADGGAKPDCAFECTEQCTSPRSARPVTNKQIRYCSPCLIKRASCEASFSFWRNLGSTFALDESGYGCSETTPC